MVQISFAEDTRSLPEDKELIKKKFVEYLGTTSDADIRDFRGIIRNMLRYAKRNETLQETKEAVSELVREILEDENLSYQIYSMDGEAFADFLGRNPQEKERRNQLAKESSLFEIFTDDDLYLDMIGASGLKAGRYEEQVPRPRILGSGGFLNDEGIEEIDVDKEKVTIEVIASDIPKRFVKQIEDALTPAQYKKDREKFFAEEEKLLRTFLANPDFLSSIYFNFRLEDKEKITAHIPEVEILGKNNVANAMIEHYVDDIRNLHNIRSGGFVPEGRFYTRETGRKTKEIKFDYFPIGERTETIDLSRDFDYDKLLRIYKEELEEQGLFFIYDKEVVVMTFTVNILEFLKNSSFIKRDMQDLEAPNELKLLEYFITLNINQPKTSEIKAAKNTKEASDVMNQALSKSKIKIEIRQARLGKFDFSIYSKAGQVVSDKMGEHLEDIRVKLDWLESRGIEGGI